MDCRQCSDDLTAYIDGELADPDVEQMRRHLGKCPPCNTEYQDLRDSTTFVVSHVQAFEPVPEIWNNLRSRIVEMPAPTGSLGFFRLFVVNRWATAAATLAATVVLTLGLWGYMKYQQSQSEIESYMNDYVQRRNISEKLHHLQLKEALRNFPDAEATGLGTMENPFEEMHPVSYSNPFRPEPK